MYNTGDRKVNTLKNKLVKLFFSTLYLSAFTFGGGYVIVSLMRRKFVDDYHWIDEDEMLDFGILEFFGEKDTVIFKQWSENIKKYNKN